MLGTEALATGCLVDHGILTLGFERPETGLGVEATHLEICNEL
jgi:hypothetical protein